MTAVPESTTWIVFNEVGEIKTANGGMFYMFRRRPYIPVCRLDQRFAPLIENELERLREGEDVDIACIPDPTREGDWRISLKYYETRHAELAPGRSDLLQLPTATSKQQVIEELEDSSKEIKVDLPLEYTKMLQERYSLYKVQHDDCATLREFRNKVIMHQLEPFLWGQIPF